jgi:hypothetical protein
LLDRLLKEIPRWQPTSATQPDDITLIVIDVMQGASERVENVRWKDFSRAENIDESI